MKAIYFDRGDEKILTVPYRFTAILKGRDLTVDYSRNDLAETVLSIRENRDFLKEGIRKGIIYFIDIETNSALEKRLYELAEEDKGDEIGGLAGGIFLIVIDAIDQAGGNPPCQ